MIIENLVNWLGLALWVPKIPADFHALSSRFLVRFLSDALAPAFPTRITNIAQLFEQLSPLFDAVVPLPSVPNPPLTSRPKQQRNCLVRGELLHRHPEYQRWLSHIRWSTLQLFLRSDQFRDSIGNRCAGFRVHWCHPVRCSTHKLSENDVNEKASYTRTIWHCLTYSPDKFLYLVKVEHIRARSSYYVVRWVGTTKFNNDSYC